VPAGGLMAEQLLTRAEGQGFESSNEFAIRAISCFAVGRAASRVFQDLRTRRSDVTASKGIKAGRKRMGGSWT
jgi:hypothetical protein